MSLWLVCIIVIPGFWDFDPVCKTNHRAGGVCARAPRARVVPKAAPGAVCRRTALLAMFFIIQEEVVVVMVEEEEEVESVPAGLMESRKCVWTSGSPGVPLEPKVGLTSEDGETRVKAHLQLPSKVFYSNSDALRSAWASSLSASVRPRSSKIRQEPEPKFFKTPESESWIHASCYCVLSGESPNKWSVVMSFVKGGRARFNDWNSSRVLKWCQALYITVAMCWKEIRWKRRPAHKCTLLYINAAKSDVQRLEKVRSVIHSILRRKTLKISWNRALHFYTFLLRHHFHGFARILVLTKLNKQNRLITEHEDHVMPVIVANLQCSCKI